MASGRWHPGECKGCGLKASDGFHISALGWCETCGVARERANLDQLRAHTGPWFHHWRRSIAASVGGVLLDDVRDET